MPTTPLRIHDADPVDTVPSPKQHNHEIYPVGRTRGSRTVFTAKWRTHVTFTDVSACYLPAIRFAVDSPVEEAVSSEPVSVFVVPWYQGKIQGICRLPPELAYCLARKEADFGEFGG